MLLCPWTFPSKNTGVDDHSLLQQIFPTQGSNLGLLHCRQILYHLSHQRSSIFGSGHFKIFILQTSLFLASENHGQTLF